MGRMKTKSLHTNSGNYFSWLCDIIKPQYKGKDYNMLFLYLFGTEFIWFVANDDNRYFDALQLRQEYEHSKIGIPVSVLEVFITLAQHMDDNIFEEEVGSRLDECFWEMVCNLGLDECHDEVYNVAKVEEICTTWLHRRYEKSGEKGVFPLKKAGVDQTTVELWYQMATYLLENHSF